MKNKKNIKYVSNKRKHFESLSEKVCKGKVELYASILLETETEKERVRVREKVSE